MTDKTPETRFKLLESVNYPEDLRLSLIHI